MMHPPRLIPALALAAATAVVMTGCDTAADRPAEMDTDTMAQQPGVTGMPAEQEMYEARIEALQGSGVTGTATFTRENGELQVTVAATGLPPNTRVPQHVHKNASCDNAGGIALNLDDALSAPSQGEPRGDAYPESNDRGEIRYQASRSLNELQRAMGGSGQADTAGANTADTTGRGATRADTGRRGTAGGVAGQAAMDTLNLGNRVVKLHNAQMQAIACGTLERMEHGQQGGTRQPQ